MTRLFESNIRDEQKPFSLASLAAGFARLQPFLQPGAESLF